MGLFLFSIFCTRYFWAVLYFCLLERL